ncbi:unnamed protein product [Bemisia tabaci]|uniref:Ionotropic receptor n=1 Tax=Bemisia tabaci TaxID=7038 RepID=A0A9P0F050_BEMTA|nr:unnamed protein product [Bemisia tabaci]
MHTLVCFILLFIAPVISGYFTGLEPSKKDEWELLSSLTFHVSRKIVNISEVKLLYVVEIYSYPRFTEFIHALHETSIQTVSISHHSKITSSVDIDHTKNIIFTLDDVSDLFDLIFYTTSHEKPIGQEEKLIQIPISDGNRNAYLPEILPRCCIKVDGHYLWLTAAERKKCSMEVSLTSRELSDHSILSDQVFNVTRGLFLNNIWNFKNYLIFLVKSFGHITKRSALSASRNTTLEHSGADMTGTLIFCFRFFWRFFKGHKAVICHPCGCERYDPFAENLISFQDWEGADEAFFDFSWRNMHKKYLTVVADASDRAYRVAYTPTWTDWLVLQDTVLMHLASSVNGTFRKRHFKDDYYSEINEALKYGFDMVMFPSGIVVEGSEITKLDFTVGFDTGALGIVAPHSGYMSQGLVIFKSFSSVVWVFITATILLLGFALHTFQLSQHELFNRLYTDSEIDYYRNASSLLTLCAYFLCGSPPSLHLGHLCTGKILFLIFSFSALIISTAFLGSMTTLLSDRVMYPEIDSLKSLEESNLIIQTFHVAKSEVMSVFDQLNQSEAMKAKILDSYSFYKWYLYVSCLNLNRTVVRFPNVTDTTNEDFFASMIKQFGVVIEEVEENVHLIAEEDAFLLSLPFSSTPKANIRMKHLFKDQWVEYHLVEEYLMTYPLMGFFLKNSFYFEKYKQLIAQYFENGLARKILDTADDSSFIQGSKASTAENSDGPRPFSLNDLQSAFIGLIVGLFFSFLAFVGEISMDFFQHSAAVKFLMRFMN